MDIKKILDKIAEKYPNEACVLALYNDESGRLVYNGTENLYYQEPIVYFNTIDELVEFLWREDEVEIPVPELPENWHELVQEPSAGELAVMNENAEQLLLELGQ